METYLSCIAAYLPRTVRSNEDIARPDIDWPAEKIFSKTGIRSRYVVAPGETAGDLAFWAVKELLESQDVKLEGIDALIVGTQSPDYFLPGIACQLHGKLGLKTACGAFDYNLGCSGFTYGLWLASALINSGAAKNILLVSTDCYSRYCDIDNLSTASLFGDAATAVLLSSSPINALAIVGPTIVGTDGSGCESLAVRQGAGAEMSVSDSATLSRPHLHMDGPEVFRFALREVAPAVNRLLDHCGLTVSQIDLFLFHQANAFLLEHIRRKMGVSSERLPIALETTGNTVNASIPLLILNCIERGILSGQKTCVLMGFGVGFSWASTLVKWLR